MYICQFITAWHIPMPATQLNHLMIVINSIYHYRQTLIQLAKFI